MRLDQAAIGHILLFIRARHFGDVRTATEHQVWLRKRLKASFSEVLLKYGDPDRDYMSVMNRWFEEEMKAIR
jgi:hypothetical protein